MLNPDRRYAHESTHRNSLIPGERLNYLSEVARAVRSYHQETSRCASIVYQVDALAEAVRTAKSISDTAKSELISEAKSLWQQLPEAIRAQLDAWPALSKQLEQD